MCAFWHHTNPTGAYALFVVSCADPYVDKLLEALGRQHSRDLFDVRDVLPDESIDAARRNDRPELLEGDSIRVYPRMLG